MTPEQVIERLQCIFPKLDWKAQVRPQYTEEYFGSFQDRGLATCLFSVTRWVDSDGNHVPRVDLLVVGKSSPHCFKTIEETLDWLEWFQYATEKPWPPRPASVRFATVPEPPLV